MSKFKIGDRAKVIGGIDNNHRSYIGTIVTIESGLICSRFNPTGEWYDIYAVDIDKAEMSSTGLYTDVAFRPCDLKPAGDDDEEASLDRLEEITAWRPKELVHVETSS